MREIICSRNVPLGEYPCERAGSKNKCWIDVTLYTDRGHVQLSICGTVYNSDETDELRGGQCLDYMASVPGMSENGMFSELYEMWRNYHNNGLHAGTRKQEEALKSAGVLGYAEACEYLKKHGMYTDDLSDDEAVYGYEEDPEKRKGLAYGEAWIVRKLPDGVVSRVKEICAEGGE